MGAKLSPEMEVRIQALAKKEGKTFVQMERELLEEALERREKNVGKRCPKCLKGHPQYFRIFPMSQKLCPNCGTRLEVIEIKNVEPPK